MDWIIIQEYLTSKIDKMIFIKKENITMPSVMIKIFIKAPFKAFHLLLGKICLNSFLWTSMEKIRISIK